MYNGIKLNSLSKAIYISEQVCMFIGWHITGAYYTAKVTFFVCQSLGCVLNKCAYYIQIVMVTVDVCVMVNLEAIKNDL